MFKKKYIYVYIDSMPYSDLSYSDLEKLRYGTVEEFDEVAKKINPKYIEPLKNSRKAVRKMYIDILENGNIDVVFKNSETNDQPTTSLDMKNCIDKNTVKLETVDGYSTEESAKIAIANCKSFQYVLQDKLKEYVNNLPFTESDKVYLLDHRPPNYVLGGKRRRQSKKKRNSRRRKHKSLHKR